VGLFP